MKKNERELWHGTRMIVEWDGPTLCPTEVPEGEDRKGLGKAIFKKIMTENFPEEMNDMANWMWK